MNLMANAVSGIWANLFANLHSYYDLKVPDSLREVAGTTENEQVTDSSIDGIVDVQRGRRVSIFVSYAHEDLASTRQLVKHIKTLTFQGLAEIWWDEGLRAGDEWRQEIDSRLNSAEVVLLIMSIDFLDSTFIQEVELPIALRRHREGRCRIIPVIMRHVDWKYEPYDRFQAVPRGAKPIISWDDHDEAYTDVTKSLKK